MKTALRVYWWALRNTYEELFSIAGINLAWWGIGLALPMAAGYFGRNWLGILLLLILLPPPTAGIYYCADLMARGKQPSFGLFWEGTRKYLVKSWLVAWLGILVAVILVTNIWFYGQYQGGWVIWVRAFFLSMLLYWGAMQMYVFPMLLALKEEKLLLALRNAAILVVTNPLCTGLLALLLVATVALSVVLVLPATFFMTVLVALICTRAVVQLLQDYRQRAENSSPE